MPSSFKPWIVNVRRKGDGRVIASEAVFVRKTPEGAFIATCRNQSFGGGTEGDAVGLAVRELFPNNKQIELVTPWTPTN